MYGIKYLAVGAVTITTGTTVFQMPLPTVLNRPARRLLAELSFSTKSCVAWRHATVFISDRCD
jgi:hypothetical protein